MRLRVLHRCADAAHDPQTQLPPSLELQHNLNRLSDRIPRPAWPHQSLCYASVCRSPTEPQRRCARPSRSCDTTPSESSIRFCRWVPSPNPVSLTRARGKGKGGWHRPGLAKTKITIWGGKKHGTPEKNRWKRVETRRTTTPVRATRLTPILYLQAIDLGSYRTYNCMLYRRVVWRPATPPRRAGYSAHRRCQTNRGRTTLRSQAPQVEGPPGRRALLPNCVLTLGHLAVHRCSRGGG